MKTIKTLAGLACSIALLTGGCAYEKSKGGNMAADARSVVARPSGFVLVREYVDSVKTDKGDEYRQVQYGWDYDQGSAVQRISSMDGKLMSSQAIPELTLETTPNELEYAFELVRNDPALAAIARRADANIYGGFSLKGNASDLSSPPAHAACLAKSRCIHIIISGGLDGEVALGHAIVNLATGLVVDANYRGEDTVVSKLK